MTRDAQQSGEEVHGSRTQLANAPILATSSAPAAPQVAAAKGLKFPDSPDVSGLDRTQSIGWIAQLRMADWHKPTSFPDEKSKRRYASNRLREVALGQMLPHIRQNRDIGLQCRLAYIELLQAAFGDPGRVATANQRMREIKPQNREFSQYYAEFKVIGANLDCNPLALRNPLQMALSETMMDSMTYSDTPDELPAVVTVYQKPKHQMWQRRPERVARDWGGGIFASSTKLPAPLKDPVAALAKSVAGYAGSVPMDLS